MFVLLILTLNSPGLLFLFVNQRELVLQLDVIKLIMISAAISTPVLLINIIIGAIFDFEKEVRKGESKENDSSWLPKITVFGCIMTNLVFGISLFLKLFLNYDLKKNILYVGRLQIVLCGLFLLELCYFILKKKMKDKKT